MRWGICAFVFFLTSCQSNVRQASHAANLIRETARSSEARFGLIEREVAADPPDFSVIASNASEGAQEQQRIQRLVGGLQERLTGTQDRSSPWIGVLNLWGWIALMAMSLGVLGYFGVIPLLRKLMRVMPGAS